MNILKTTVKEATIAQPSLQRIKRYPVCNFDFGDFLALTIGWHNQQRVDRIMVDARQIEEQFSYCTFQLKQGQKGSQGVYPRKAATVSAMGFILLLAPHKAQKCNISP